MINDQYFGTINPQRKDMRHCVLNLQLSMHGDSGYRIPAVTVPETFDGSYSQHHSSP